MGNKPKKLILFDGNAIIHRAYHALPPLVTSKGELVNAVYGFASTVLSVIDKFKPDHILATFDLDGGTFRHVEYKEYKAKRVKADQDLYDQIPRVKEFTRAMGIPIYEKQGFEADDVIGTMVEQAKKFADIECMVVTGDLDTLQLVGPRTKVYAMRRGLTDSVLYDEAKILERYGLRPDQLIDFKGLRGDPSDNIPGVKGIGEKTACELLKKYDTLDGVYAHIREIKGATKEKLERDKMQAWQSRRLATIVRDVPVELDLPKTAVGSFDRNELVRFFQEMNFYSLVKRIPEIEKASGAEKPKVGRDSEGVKDFKYEYVAEDKMAEYVKMLLEQKTLSLKLKTRGEKVLTKELEGIAVSYKIGRSAYFPFSDMTAGILRQVLENPGIKKIGYDLKSDIEVLKKHGISLKGELADVMLASYALNPGGKTDLPTLVLSELGEEVKAVSQKGQLGLEMETPEEAAEKVSREADYIFKLNLIFADKIKVIASEQKGASNLENIYREIEMPLVPILAEMELRGVKLNTVIFKGISKKIEGRLKNLEESICALAGEKFNINSPKQLTDILFNKLKLPTTDIRRGKTGYSTASSELQKLKRVHKIIEKIEDYREMSKLKNTYLDTLPLLADQESRVHTCFNQAVTSTGRLSSSEPNLQNIPIRTELGQLLRVAFEAEKGWRLVSADYSQIDLRSVAHVSRDKKMIELFHAGEDIHRATAAEINKVPLSKVTEKMRSAAKALNFGVIYGMSVFGFSQGAGIDREEARRFIDAYFERFLGVAKYMKQTKEFAKVYGFIETEMGRRRYVPEINSPNFQVAQAGERMAINMPIQGMSADIVKLAMIKVYEEYKNDPEVKMILQVHDEIILEVKEEKAEQVAVRVKELMQNVYKLKVPLVVDVKVGDNWGEI